MPRTGMGDVKFGLNATEKAVKQSKFDEYRVVTVNQIDHTSSDGFNFRL
jgi:hypothetical protein